MDGNVSTVGVSMWTCKRCLQSHDRAVRIQVFLIVQSFRSHLEPTRRPDYCCVPAPAANFGYRHVGGVRRRHDFQPRRWRNLSVGSVVVRWCCCCWWWWWFRCLLSCDWLVRWLVTTPVQKATLDPHHHATLNHSLHSTSLPPSFSDLLAIFRQPILHHRHSPPVSFFLTIGIDVDQLWVRT